MFPLEASTVPPATCERPCEKRNANATRVNALAHLAHDDLPRRKMRILMLLLVFIASCHAMTVTYRMQPNERACFYVLTRKADEKLAFYYAVRLAFFGALTTKGSIGRFV